MGRHNTIRIRPFEGESLSSYMMRCAEANGISFLAFWNSVKDMKHELMAKNHYAQLDYIYLLNYLPLNIVNYTKISKVTGLKNEEVFNMTLYNAICKFSLNEKLERSRCVSGMIHDEVYHYCPFCIKEKAYNRLLWTIKGITHCMKHNARLHNSCPTCGKLLLLKEVFYIGVCPHCGEKLSVCKEPKRMTTSEFKQQLFIHSAWEILLHPTTIKYSNETIALKALFILNNQKWNYDRETVSSNILNSKSVDTLLQHARGTLEQERNLHLQFIFDILMKLEISFEDFINIKVPEQFIRSLKNGKIEKGSLCCKAPWCENNNQPNSLVSIATSYKRKFNGEFQSCYYICPKCGCEYIYDSKGSLIERTNFIEGYSIITRFYSEKLEFKELSIKSGLKKDRLKRLLAYYYSNKILKPIRIFSDKKVNNELLKMFVEDVENGENVEDIKRKTYWDNYFQYLLHRYNNKVIQAFAKEQSLRHINKDTNDKQAEIKEVVDEMLRCGMGITINNVCEKAGIAHDSLRNWNCLGIISKMKMKQKGMNNISS